MLLQTPCYLATWDHDTLSQWLAEQQSGNLILALLPEAELPRLPLLQQAFNDAGVSLLGGVFPKLLTDSGFAAQGIILLPIQNSLGHFLIEYLPDDALVAGMLLANEAMARLPAAPQGPPPHLFLIFDGMQPNIATAIIALFEQLKGRVKYAGVNAGSESFQPMPCLFDNQRCVGRGAIGLLLAPQTAVAVQHGYQAAAPLMRATSTQHNCINKIDGLPALDVYRQVIADELGLELTADNFYDCAVHYPFGLVSALEIVVRIPVAFNEAGAIVCIGEIPANSMLRLLQAPVLADSNCIDQIARYLAPRESAPMMSFYCAGRRLHFGEDATHELAALSQKCQAKGLFGALSLGEIGSNNEFGIPEFHNAALVCLR